MKISLLSLFSGIGALEKALSNLGVDVDLVGFSEIDIRAIKSYCGIHSVDEGKNLGDITKIDIPSLPKDIDLLMHGSPCQDFSVAGHKKGGDEGSETRSSLMWNTVEIVAHCLPKFIIWENVTGLLSQNNKHNFERYVQKMDTLGYTSHSEVLNGRQFGLAHNRERVFVVSIRKDLDRTFVFEKGVWDTTKLIDFLDDEVDSRFFVKKHDNHRYTKNYLQYDNSGKGYNSQAARAYYLDNFMCTLPKSNGGDKTQVLLNKKPIKIRRITPKEAWRLQGFTDDDFDKAEKTGQTMGSLYAQAGNSICVPILESIVEGLIN